MLQGKYRGHYRGGMGGEVKGEACTFPSERGNKKNNKSPLLMFEIIETNFGEFSSFKFYIKNVTFFAWYLWVKCGGL